MTTAAPKIKLYTSHRCPWAGRVHVALSALNLPYSEEIIDLDNPRPAAYLKLNPRGKVPTIQYNSEILTESGIIATFLADAHPGLLPEDALERARLNWFVDAYCSFASPQYNKVLGAKTDDEAEGFAREFVDKVAKEVEPELHRWNGTGPFFGGSETVTLAEALVGPFLLRLFSAQAAGLLPASLVSDLQVKTPKFYEYTQAVIANDHVKTIYDDKIVTEGLKKRVQKARSTS